MTVVQEVLLQLDGDYLGHPYYVSGHALFNALARKLDDAASRSLQVSNGVFVPGEFGAYPDEHSQSGGVPYMGAGLRPVERYEDLFLFRDAAHRWLSESRPRDAHNTHPLREYGDRTGFGSSRSFGRPAEAHHSKRTVNWYVQVYLHSDGRGDAVPLLDETLDGLRLGGARNYGFGVSSLVETQTFDLDELDYDRISDADAHRIELLSPFVLASDYPGAECQEVPWWWAGDGDLRRRESQLVKGDDVYELATIDHGQVVGYAGDDVVATARNGVLRVGTHAKYGFGEFRVRPAGEDRVPKRGAAVRDASRGES
jgi:hypothetical protein